VMSVRSVVVFLFFKYSYSLPILLFV
jgi:hypothetical protein